MEEEYLFFESSASPIFPGPPPDALRPGIRSGDIQPGRTVLTARTLATLYSDRFIKTPSVNKNHELRLNVVTIYLFTDDFHLFHSIIFTVYVETLNSDLIQRHLLLHIRN